MKIVDLIIDDFYSLGDNSLQSRHGCIHSWCKTQCTGSWGQYYVSNKTLFLIINYSTKANFFSFTLYFSEVTGYVDQVFASKTSSKTVGGSYKLFKFVLNNNSTRRVTVCMWGEELINMYEPRIICNQVNYHLILLFLKLIINWKTIIIKLFNFRL